MSLTRNFNPRAPCGARHRLATANLSAQIFQSTRPVWGATKGDVKHNRTNNYFNPRAPCGARQARAAARRVGYYISIHAPRVGRDCPFCGDKGVVQNFNPRAPCGARLRFSSICSASTHFNPRAPCGARLTHRSGNWRNVLISIHAPRVGRDRCRINQRRKILFQSTRPVWGATRKMLKAMGIEDISIHAPRVGRDGDIGLVMASTQNFNPRAPCGARPILPTAFRNSRYFNPRAPCGARRDLPLCLWLTRDFNPRAPCGARQQQLAAVLQLQRISIHAPRVGRDDACRACWLKWLSISIHAPRVGRDLLSNVVVWW